MLFRSACAVFWLCMVCLLQHQGAGIPHLDTVYYISDDRHYKNLLKRAKEQSNCDIKVIEVSKILLASDTLNHNTRQLMFCLILWTQNRAGEAKRLKLQNSGILFGKSRCAKRSIHYRCGHFFSRNAIYRTVDTAAPDRKSVV